MSVRSLPDFLDFGLGLPIRTVAACDRELLKSGRTAPGFIRTLSACGRTLSVFRRTRAALARKHPDRPRTVSAKTRTISAKIRTVWASTRTFPFLIRTGAALISHSFPNCVGNGLVPATELPLTPPFTATSCPTQLGLQVRSQTEFGLSRR